MPFPALNDGFSPKTVKKLIIFLIIFMLCMILFFVGYIYFTSNRNKYFEKKYKKEIKALNISLDSLKSERKNGDKKVKEIEQKITEIEAQSAAISAELENQYKKINAIKKGYEKINSYTDISNDSLRRIFAERFGGR